MPGGPGRPGAGGPARQAEPFRARHQLLRADHGPDGDEQDHLERGNQNPLSHRGPVLSVRDYVYEITAAVTAILPDGSTSNVPPALITVLGLQLGTNGHAYKRLADNTTNDVTPKATNFNHYGYTVRLDKVMVDLAFRSSPDQFITHRETNGPDGTVYGFDPAAYDFVVTRSGTNRLGTRIVFTNSTGVFFYRNVQETDAIVPKHPWWDAGMQWRQDVQLSVFEWNPSDPDIISPLSNETFSVTMPGFVGAPNDSPLVGIDEIPDSNGLIISTDGPAVAPPAGRATRTILAYRLYAHQWLVKSGTVVSPLLKWHCFITIKLDVGGWRFVGTNEIELTGAEDMEIPAFTADEAKGL